MLAHPGAELYGSDRVFLESVEALINAEWRVVVTLPTSGPLVAELAARGAMVEICRVPVLRKSSLRPLGIIRLLVQCLQSLIPAARVVRASGCSVVYVNTFTIPYWVAIARVMGRPVVAHVHEAESGVPRRIRWLMAIPFLLCRNIIVNSQVTLTVLDDSLSRLTGRAHVILNAVAGPDQAAPARPKIEGPLRLLFFGRLAPRKGPDIAIEALKQLIDQNIDAQLTLMGAVFPGYEWFEQELVDKVAGDGLTDRVHFLGFRPDIWPVLAAADITVVPSLLDESFGNAAIEAVLAKRPLVASDIPGLREAGSGYQSLQLVTPNDAAALARAIRRVIENWDQFRAAAIADSVLAAARHDPLRYQRDIAEYLDIVVAGGIRGATAP